MDDLCMIVLKIKITRDKSFFVMSIYRQWNLPTVLQTNPDKCWLLAYVDRLTHIFNQLKLICDGVIPIIFQGDLNIDQWAPMTY